MKQNTVIFNPIRPDLIERALETLYRYTPPNFYVYVVDQTRDGLPKALIDKYVHMYIRPRRNLGFSKSANTGIRLVETPYFMLANDDIEWISRQWWQGVLDTFTKVDTATPTRPCCMVCPASIKLPDWSVGRPSGDHFYILPYQEAYSQADWDFLVNEPHFVNEHLTIQPGSVIDGVVCYAPVFQTERFKKVGFLPEKYYPGSGEDYSWNCRANMVGYRSVGTTLSWVYHHWSSSLGNQSDYGELIDPNLRWNDTSEEWGPNFDLWGVKCPECQAAMTSKDGLTATCLHHPNQIYSMPPITKIPL